MILDAALTQRRRQNVGRCDRILHGEIDADAADRGHGVRRVADAEQAGLVPLLQAIYGDGQQLDVIPTGEARRYDPPTRAGFSPAVA